jgi:hypothetical protein
MLQCFAQGLKQRLWVNLEATNQSCLYIEKEKISPIISFLLINYNSHEESKKPM